MPDIKEITYNPKADESRLIKGYTSPKGVDLASRTISGLASTISLDRDGEIVLPSAIEPWARRFTESNAPFLAAHTHRAADAGPTQIGWVASLSITKTDVRAVFRFARTALAEQWWQLASDPDGKGIAFSIGFRPRRAVYGSAADLAGKYPEIRATLRDAGLADDDRLTVYTEIELLEISAVPVPSNRESLQALAAKAAADGGYEKLVRDLAAEVAVRIAEFPRLAGRPAADEPAADGAKALQSEIRDLKSEIHELVELVTALLPDCVNEPSGGDSSPRRRAGSSSPAGGVGDVAADAARELRKAMGR